MGIGNFNLNIMGPNSSVNSYQYATHSAGIGFIEHLKFFDFMYLLGNYLYYSENENHK